VASGELTVTVDGSRRPHVLGPGDSFGEIALLRQVPRTATITASTDVRLLGLDADAFLAVVTGSPDGHAVAAEVTAAHLLRDQTADEPADQGTPR
jgi:CRP-like cAMP-binding protein